MSPASEVKFYLSVSSSPVVGSSKLLGSRTVPSLVAAAVSSKQTSVGIPASTPSGQYYLLAVVDAANKIAEVSETNNTRTVGALTVSGPGQSAAPAIAALTPTQGAPGIQITATGKNFGPVFGTVRFGQTQAHVTVWTNTKVQVTVPALLAGDMSVVIGNAFGNSNAVQFSVKAPTINRISPLTGSVRTAVTLNGSDFGIGTSDSSVFIGGIQAAITSWSDTAIKVSAPVGLSGSVPVKVKTPAGESNQLIFTYLSSGSDACSGVIAKILKPDCKIVAQLRDKKYLGIASDAASDDALLNYIALHRGAINAWLREIDYGYDVKNFLDDKTGQGSDLSLVKELSKAGVDFVQVWLKIKGVLSGSVVLDVVSEIVSPLKTIADGISIYRSFAGMIIAPNLKATLQDYVGNRSGMGTASAWSEIVEVYEPVLLEIAGLRGCMKQGDICLQELGVWYENAYSAYRLAGSEQLRSAIGEAIGQLAGGS